MVFREDQEFLADKLYAIHGFTYEEMNQTFGCRYFF